MSNTNIEVSLPLDDDGYISRECPYCKMRFKVHKDDFDGEKFPEEIYCPYCGQSASKDEFWTSEQIKYFQDMVMCKVVAPELDEFDNNLKGLNISSGLLDLKVSIDREETTMPVAPEEMGRMNLHEQTCCKTVIKVETTLDKGFYCLICGKRG